MKRGELRHDDLPPVMTPELAGTLSHYLRLDRGLHPKSAKAIESVLRAAYEQLEASKMQRFYVTATVSAWIDAEDKGTALQELCDRLAHGVPDQYGVNTVDATESPGAEGEAAA